VQAAAAELSTTGTKGTCTCQVTFAVLRSFAGHIQRRVGIGAGSYQVPRFAVALLLLLISYTYVSATANMQSTLIQSQAAHLYAVPSQSKTD
jgi:hypothetical protein